jgi:hypothetical protein
MHGAARLVLSKALRQSRRRSIDWPKGELGRARLGHVLLVDRFSQPGVVDEGIGFLPYQPVTAF